MRNGAQEIYDALQRLTRSIPNDQRAFLQVPVPDARFFNAALDVYARQDGMRMRGHHSTPTHWRRQRRLAERYYAKFGITSKHWSAAVQSITDEMERLGYEVPDGVRPWLVGRGFSGACGSKHRRPLRTPYAFGRYQPKYRPYALPVAKERGQPLRKRWLCRPRTSRLYDT